MENCIFCKIIEKEIHSSIVYEDEEILAFNDIHPLAPVHILIIPKKHINSVMSIENKDIELIGKIHMVIKKIVKQMGIEEQGFRIVVNCGEDAGQEVKHLHYHLLGGKKLGTKIVE